MISTKTIETCVFSVGIAKLSNNMIVQTKKTSRARCLDRFSTTRFSDWCQNLTRHNEPPTAEFDIEEVMREAAVLFPPGQDLVEEESRCSVGGGTILGVGLLVAAVVGISILCYQ